MKISHELETAIKAAQKAAEIQRQNFQKPVQKTMKGPKDFATQTDFACEKAILEILKKEFPDYGVLAEESGQHETESEYEWIIDPLDGTILFAFGVPTFGSFIALRKKNELQLGVTIQSVSQEVLFAEKNKGAYYNNQKIAFSKTQELKDSYLFHAGISKPLREYPQTFNRLVQTVSYPSSTNWLQGLFPVCRGKADILLGTTMSTWDRAAPKIIIEEAGGILSDYQGKTALENNSGTVIANPILHQKLIALFAEEKP